MTAGCLISDGSSDRGTDHKPGPALCAAFSFLLMVVAASPLCAARSLTFRDAGGSAVAIAVPVNRALFHVNCELIPVLGVQSRVVGVGKWCNENDVLRAAGVALPVVSSETTNMNIESVVRLKPDLIISWPGVRKETEYLERRGFKTVSFNPRNLAELYEMLRIHGRMFGREERANRAIREMRRILRIVSERTSTIPEAARKKGLWLSTAPTRVMCRFDLKHELLGVAHLDNPASAIPLQNSEVSLETIMKWDPDVIFIPVADYRSYRLSDILDNPRWRHIRAVRERRVYEFDHRITTWSPSFAPIALWMAAKAYPERFRDLNIEKIIDDFYRKVYRVSGKKVWNDFK